MKGAANMLESGAEYLKNVAANCKNLDKDYVNYRKDCELTVHQSTFFSLLEDISQRYR